MIMNINLFKDFFSKSPIASNMEEVVNQIKYDEKLKAFTESYRLSHVKDIKLQCHMFAVACLFDGGKALKDVKAITGLGICDLDHVPAENMEEVKRRVMEDNHFVLFYTTISGRGFRIIFRYDQPDNLTLQEQIKFYGAAFATGNAYYDQLLKGLLSEAPDPACKNITRLSGLCHDEHVVYRKDATPFTIAEIAVHRQKVQSTNKEIQRLKRIQDYYDKVICPKLEKENITYQPGQHNKYVMRVGYWLADKRYNKSSVIKWAKETFPDYDGTEQVINSCFSDAKETGKNKDKATTANVSEIQNFLDDHVNLRFNVITHRVEYKMKEGEGKWQPICDRAVNSLWTKLSVETRVYATDIFRVIESDYVPSFHPFSAYLESLPEWHEGDPDYIAELAATVKVKDEDAHFTFQYALRKWIVAMVAAWIDETVVNNVILVLIGEQGTYKTTWLNHILPPDLQAYFYTKTNANRMSKDDLITLSQYALECYEELENMSSKDLNQLKAAVTMRSIDERAPYAHFSEKRNHTSSLCATGNSVEFLSDPTGNRRWLPFEVESIQSPQEHPFHYEGIYSQAYALYKSGFQFWFDKKEIQAVNRHNKLFETPRLERELVDLYFAKPTQEGTGIFITIAHALQYISNGISQKLSAINVSRAFKELGFERKRTKNSRGYIVVIRSAEDIRRYQHSQMVESQPDDPTQDGLSL